MSDTPVQPATTSVEKGAMRVIKQAGETVEEARARRRAEARVQWADNQPPDETWLQRAAEWVQRAKWERAQDERRQARVTEGLSMMTDAKRSAAI